MNILFVGDVYGSAGRHIVREHLPHVLENNAVDLLVVNGENAAGGFGITPSIAEELFDMGAHVITTGNHIWDKKEIFEYMTVPADSHGRGRRVIRPANYADGTPGFGVYQGELGNGQRYAVINLQGRVFMSSCDDPFRKADELLGQIEREFPGAKVILLDLHAEATSEKVALGWYLDGRVTAMLGTHTHIPTADERILPDGTAYQTDVGMSGPYDSVDRGRKGTDTATFFDGYAGKVRSSEGQSQDVCRADLLRWSHGPRSPHPANHARRIGITRAEPLTQKRPPLRAASSGDITSSYWWVVWCTGAFFTGAFFGSTTSLSLMVIMIGLGVKEA